MKKLLLSLVLVLACASMTFAGECNGPGDDECCQTGGENVPINVACTNVVEANPAAFCASFAAAVCETDCGSAAASCAGSLAACSQSVSVTCPDITPACAKWRYRRNQAGLVIAQKCVRWVVTVVN